MGILPNRLPLGPGWLSRGAGEERPRPNGGRGAHTNVCRACFALGTPRGDRACSAGDPLRRLVGGSGHPRSGLGLVEACFVTEGAGTAEDRGGHVLVRRAPDRAGPDEMLQFPEDAAHGGEAFLWILEERVEQEREVIALAQRIARRRAEGLE